MKFARRIIALLLFSLQYSSGNDPREFKGNSSDVFSSISKTLRENVSATVEATSNFTAHDFVNATLWETVTLLASSNIPTSVTTGNDTTASHIDLCKATSTADVKSNYIHQKAGFHKEDAGWFSVTFRKATTASPAISTVRTSAAPRASPRNRTLWDQLEDIKRVRAAFFDR